jgi:outer membrane protein OmpA-like peptidoglycan-associated protein
LNIPQNGIEARLLAFIQDPSMGVEPATWFDFDRLLFNTDSATLRPESQEQLGNIAAILKAYPNVHIKIGGYTDNSGDAQHNLTLSQDRANGVMAELIARGISPDRLEAQGYGEQFPVADNSTAEGRARNRRVSMRVTQK